EIEAVRVVDALDVAARPGVAVPVPGAADVVGALDHLRPKPKCAQMKQHVQAGEPSAHDHDVEVWRVGARGRGCGSIHDSASSYHPSRSFLHLRRYSAPSRSSVCGLAVSGTGTGPNLASPVPVPRLRS